MALTAVKTSLNKEPFASKIADALDTFSSQTVADLASLAGGGAQTGVIDLREVRLATAAPMPGGTAVYNGPAQTLTAAANGALVLDGVTAALTDRILVAGEATASNNGIYSVTAIGGAGAKWVLTRAADMNTSAGIQPAMQISVSEGTVYAGTEFVLTTSQSTGYVLDTTSLSFLPSLGGDATVAPAFRARNVVITNVADLTAFTGVTGGSANNGVTCVQGDALLLVNQTTVAQNGLYIVGPVSAGTAPLFRAARAGTGAAIIPDTTVQIGSEPTVGKNTIWRASIANTTGLYGTNDPKFICDLGNCIDMVSTTTGNSGAAPSSYFFAGLVLVAKSTGIFEVDIDVACSSDTTAQPFTLVFLTDTSASGALGGANNVAHGISGVTAGIGSQAGAGATVDTNGGATMTYNSAAWNTAPITQKTQIIGTLTGLLTTNGSGTSSFTYHGKVYNAAQTGTTKTPFTIGNSVGFGIKVTAAGGTVSFPHIKFSAREVLAG